MKPIRKRKKKKFKEVSVLTAFQTVYVKIDTPTLKVLIPINNDSLKEQGFQKSNFELVKNNIEMAFFIQSNILQQVKNALKNINPTSTTRD